MFLHMCCVLCYCLITNGSSNIHHPFASSEDLFQLCICFLLLYRWLVSQTPPLKCYASFEFLCWIILQKKKKKARNAQCLCLHRAINATYLDFHKQPLTCPLIVLYLAVWASTGRMQEQPQNQGWNAEYLFSSPFPLGDPWMWAEAHKWGHRHRGTLSRRISSSAVYAC